MLLATEWYLLRFFFFPGMVLEWMWEAEQTEMEHWWALTHQPRSAQQLHGAEHCLFA